VYGTLKTQVEGKPGINHYLVQHILLASEAARLVPPAALYEYRQRAHFPWMVLRSDEPVLVRPDDRVRGELLWFDWQDYAEANERLDWLEDVDKGVYVRHLLEVQRPGDDASIAAWVYVAGRNARRLMKQSNRFVKVEGDSWRERSLPAHRRRTTRTTR
jgi:gamma-glutamylcyclotransferase (GGCT)/AIG2-like uncharacterized protein YtfP